MPRRTLMDERSILKCLMEKYNYQENEIIKSTIPKISSYGTIYCCVKNSQIDHKSRMERIFFVRVRKDNQLSLNASEREIANEVLNFGLYHHISPSLLFVVINSKQKLIKKFDLAIYLERLK